MAAISPKMKMYQMKGVGFKREVDKIHSILETFKVTSEESLNFKIQGKEFKIQQTVSYSPKDDKKKEPSIWCTETICPGSPRLIYESLMEEKHRMAWDAQLAAHRQILIDESCLTVYILHSSAKASVGGLIPPRDFVDLVTLHEFKNQATGLQSLQIVSKSFDWDVPEQKGLERGVLVIGGVLLERLSDDEIQQMELPKLQLSANKEECEWTRIRYIVQTNVQSKLPQTVLNSGMSKSKNEMMNDLRNYIIQRRLGLESESQ